MPLPSKKTLKTLLALIIVIVASSPIAAKNLPSNPQIPFFITPTPHIRRKPSPSAPTNPPPIPSDKLGQAEIRKVIRIVDGDTITLEGNIKLRYIGINTPESVDPRRPVQCFAKEASQRNRELVEGQIVTLEKDVSETDKYGRLLRYVYVNGIMINKQLVQEGYALASAYPPDVKHQKELKEAEKDAQQNKRGLWSNCETK
jgi:micrococcal nuclease